MTAYIQSTPPRNTTMSSFSSHVSAVKHPAQVPRSSSSTSSLTAADQSYSSTTTTILDPPSRAQQHVRSASNTSQAHSKPSTNTHHPIARSVSSGTGGDTMMAMPVLSMRRRADSSLSAPVTASSSRRGGNGKSASSTVRRALRTPSTQQRNAGLIVIAILCFVVYMIPTRQELSDSEAAPPTPYTVPKSYLRTGSGWVLDHARVVGEKITIPRPFASSGPASLSNSKPHPKEKYPDFQDKMYKLTAKNWPEYERKLIAFSKSAFPRQLADWAVESIKERSPIRRHSRNAAKTGIPLHIWQTGKVLPTTRNSFQDQNPRASYNFFDDSLLENWSKSHFGGSLVKKVWDGMERAVLKADFWRYLVIFLEGGFYSDTDTDCLKPVDVWGTVDAVTWDLGDLVSKEVAYAPPQVVVGIEVDVPDVTGWETFWPRPIQIVQWTMSGSPGHPIYLDSIRRVVESMNVVKEWDGDRKKQAADLLSRLTSEDATLKDRKKHLEDQELWAQLRKLLTVDPFDKERGGKMSLIEATGPGAFSDAVFSYLQARYGIHWSQLHNIQTATRIGEVAILPITGFAPFWKPDWQRWKGLDKGAMAVVGDITHPQAMVNHHFSGSWRQDSDNSA